MNESHLNKNSHPHDFTPVSNVDAALYALTSKNITKSVCISGKENLQLKETDFGYFQKIRVTNKTVE
jgi:hypothetical protein